MGHGIGKFCLDADSESRSPRWNLETKLHTICKLPNILPGMEKVLNKKIKV